MACLQISRSALSSPLALRCGLPSRRRAQPLRCRIRDSDADSTGDEKPESLFMKELRRRGMTPTSLLEERETVVQEVEQGIEEDSRGTQRRRNGIASADFDKSLDGQRERSMSLNSEGLEGLLPRAKLLLTLGGTFFVGFWPLILITLVAFGALYLYSGPSFVHDASKMAVSPPPYVDPYTLLEDERISQVAPYVK